MKKILFIGGTGAIGVYLIKACISLGYKVYVTTRQAIPDEENLIYIKGDGYDKSFLTSVLRKEKFDSIVDFLVYGTEQFKERLNLLLELTDHYIFISTYRVYANSNLTPIIESSPRLLDTVDDSVYLKTDEYALAKARQEDLLRNSKYKNWTIVRPSISYSTSRFQFGTLEAQQFLKRANAQLPIIMSAEVLTKFTTMTWSGDVATMISKLVLNKKSYSDDFNVLTNEYHTWYDVSRYYKELIGIKVVEVSNEDYATVIGNKWQLKYDRMFNRVCDNTKILKFTGLAPSDLMPLSKGLAFELNQSQAHKEALANFPNEYDGKVDKILKSYQTLRISSTLKNKLLYFKGRI